MTTFVLVHGAWFGGWMWRDVAALLGQCGHDVYAPSLTGFGDRRHLLAPSVDLETHTADVVNVIETANLHDVVLVGHSYGGMVVTAVANQVGDRLRHVHYIDAFVPADGESVFTIVGALRPEMLEGLRAMVATAGQGWRLPLPFPVSQFGLDPEADSSVVQRFSDAPAAIFENAVHLTGPPAAIGVRSFLSCTERPNGLFDVMADRARSQGWAVTELAATHGAALTHPDRVANALLALA